MQTCDFLFELGVEEIPHGELNRAIGNLEKSIRERLKESELTFGEMTTYSTPRRLAVRVQQMALHQSDRYVLRKGPPLSSAWSNQSWSPPARGFFKANDLNPSSPETIPRKEKERQAGLFMIEEKGKSFLFCGRLQKGKDSIELLPSLLEQTVKKIEVPKPMIWSEPPFPFYRPIRWIVALLGDEVIPVTFAGVQAGRWTFGHRHLGSSSRVEVRPNTYEKILRENKVVADKEKRRQGILHGLNEIERHHGVKAVERKRTVEQVVNLLEWPHLFLCSYDADFLSLPREVLISEMVEHQFYFPVEDKNGKLINRFIVAANIEEEADAARGHENVLKARFTDGVFLYREDIKVGLDKMGPRLDHVLYQKDLGTLRERVKRIEEIGRLLYGSLGRKPPPAFGEVCGLMKNDLVSQMVYEFPYLQGIMGAYYAREEKREESICEAIREHYLPLSSGGDLPKTEIGVMAALADKLENILGCFAVGLSPSGRRDPYALRRSGNGIIRILLERPLSLDLAALIHSLSRYYTVYLKDGDDGRKGLEKAVIDFLRNRMRSILGDNGFAPDEIDAVTSGEIRDPAASLSAVRAARSFKKDPRFPDLIHSIKRVKNILPDPPGTHNEVKESFQSPWERKLWCDFLSIEPMIKEAMEKRNYEEAFKAYITLGPRLKDFFDHVMVNDPNSALRKNRLAMLSRIDRLFLNLLDFTRFIA